VGVALFCCSGFAEPQVTNNCDVPRFFICNDRMTKFKESLLELLQNDERLFDEQGELKEYLLRELIDQYDPKLLDLLLGHELTRDKFFVSVGKSLVFKANDFKFFIDENKLDNSYTQFENKIGLKIGSRLLREYRDVVLNFPYKDCVLEGGQSTEEGSDLYFEYDKNSGEYEEKKAKRKEVFFNQVLAKDEIDRLFEPKAFANAKRYGGDGNLKFTRDENGTIKDNLIIKGNNLLALHTLKEEFRGKVKLIYIDPPFNTGNDSFAYNDDFNHSTWMVFMRNRLEVARELMLDSESMIFINIDAIEDAYLKILCDEIFGRRNFVNVIAVKSSTPSGTKTAHRDKTIIKQKDLILVYKKGEIHIKPQYYKRENWDSHYSLFLSKNKEGNFVLSSLLEKLVELNIISKGTKIAELNLDNKTFKEYYLNNSNSIVRLQSHKNKKAEFESKIQKNLVYEHLEDGVSKGLYYNGQVITPLKQGIKTIYSNQKYVEDLGLLLCDFWTDIDFQNTQNEGGVSFPTAKKPELLLSRIIDMVTKEGDIILDFHLGSGTTASVAHKMNRQYIGIEQLNYGSNDSVVRLQNVINGEQSGISKAVNWQSGGSFLYLELAKNNQVALEKIESAESYEELMALFDEMYQRYFLNYNLKIKEFKETVSKEEDFKRLSLVRQKEIFGKILDLNQLYVNRSEMEDSRYGLNANDIAVTNDFYGF
jgi:adenine-specific DNA-methyltransferase